MIIVAQFLGLFMSAHQCVQLAVARLTKPGNERTNAFSKLGLCFGLGFMLTPIISKVASMFGGERTPLIASASISLIALPLVLFFIDNLKVFLKTLISR
jgi:MFS family permease